MTNTNWLLTKITLILFTTAVLVSAIMAAGRIGIERNYRQVELVMDYYDLIRLVREMGEEERLEDWVLRFKEAGITSLALEEETLNSLSEKGGITVFSGRQMRDFFRLTGLIYSKLWNMADGPTKLDQTYILTDDYHLAQQISWNLKDKIARAPQSFRLPSQRGGKDDYLVVVNGIAPAVLEIGIGFSPELIAWIETRGLNCILRPSNLSLSESPIDPDNFFDQVKAWPPVKGIIFSGMEVLGYPGSLAVTARRLKENDLKLGLIEFTPQKGIKELLTQVENSEDTEADQRVVRVHGIGPQEVEEITFETALSRMLRAVKERRIRLLYLRPLMPPDQKGDLLQANLDMVRALAERLNEAGFSPGTGNAWPAHRINHLLLFFICLGVVVAGGTLVRKIVFLSTMTWLCLLLSGSLLSLSVFTPVRPLIQQGFALLAAIIFPVLALFRVKSISPVSSPSFSILIKESWKDLGKITITTSVGALLIVGLLSDTTYLLNIEQFRGVKLSFILPLLGISLLLLKGKELTALLDRPVKLIHLIMGAVVLVAAIVVVARSGNFGPISALPFESKLRVWLENLLWARPRSKEFLVGYPALLAGLFLLKQGRFPSLRGWLLIIGTLSQISLINTFCHLHTPLVFSIIRSFNGFWIGSLLGTILLGLYYRYSLHFAVCQNDLLGVKEGIGN